VALLKALIPLGRAPSQGVTLLTQALDWVRFPNSLGDYGFAPVL